MQNLSPIGWALRPLKRYAEFSGRSSRAEFWWFSLFLMISYVAFWILMMVGIGASAASGTPPSLRMLGAFGAVGIIMVLFCLALLVPGIAVSVRRLHDTNRSAWWLGAFWLLYGVYMAVLLSSIGSMMSAAMAGNTQPPVPSGSLFAATGLLAIVMGVYSIVLLVFYCLPGTKGSNRFGDDPYGANVEEVFA